VGAQVDELGRAQRGGLSGPVNRSAQRENPGPRLKPPRNQNHSLRRAHQPYWLKHSHVIPLAKASEYDGAFLNVTINTKHNIYP
jgi:hypothetical protein